MEQADGQKKRTLRKALIILGWILLWQVIAWIVHNPVFFAGPAESAAELVRQAGSAVFWKAVLGSYVRILAGFLPAAAAAWLLAYAARRFALAEEVLAPFVSFLRSVPVAAVVVVFLIWSGPEYLVFYISFMVVFPNLYANLLTGLQKTDPKMLEMARAFRMPLPVRLRCIDRPACLPYLRAAMTHAVGMSFKAGIAAEIIALPEHAIGTRLYMDKIYLNTAGVFAWMAVVVLLGFVTEKAMVSLAGAGLVPKVTAKQVPLVPAKELRWPALQKRYADGTVVELPHGSVAPGERLCLMGASGSGKTTLLHILAGLMPAEEGWCGSGRAAVCFQEDRLWGAADGEVNLWMAGCDLRNAEERYRLLPEELWKKPVDCLSGGERRRVALARAVLSPSEYLLLDEPFTGLDEESKKTAAEWVLRQQNGRPILVTTHDEEDAALLHAKRMDTGI